MNNFRENEIFNVSNVPDYDNQESCSSSCDSSCCDYHSDDSIPEWNDVILENGELFFIKCSPYIDTSSTDANQKNSDSSTKRNKLTKFLRKHKLKKKAFDVRNQSYPQQNQTGVQIDDHQSDFTNVKEKAAILFLNLVNAEPENSDSSDSIIYSFPQNAENNVIYSIRGAFLTLCHLLPKLVAEVPESSTLLLDDELIHVVYMTTRKELLILALPESRCSPFELKQLGFCVVRYLNFRYKSLHECFKNSSNHCNLNQFFGNLFIKMFKNDYHSASKIDVSSTEKKPVPQFEDTFGFPYKLTIPSYIETEIEEKLNEIEANGFDDLGEDHYECQRLYTITGTCLYHKGYLISSHLSKEDQHDVHVFLRLNDLLDLTVTSMIETLVIWQEIFMTSCSYSVEGSRVFPPNKRWFMLITGQDQSLLIALLESGGCSVKIEGSAKPDELYVEQLQEILEDILHCGLPDVVEQLMKPSEFSSQNSTFKSSENLLSTVNSNTSTLTKSSSTLSCESDRLHHGSPNFANGSFEDAYSDSLSRTASSIFSDETPPVLGRRAQRLKQLSNSGSIYPLHSNLSDSDRSDLDTTSSSHSSSFTDTGKKSQKDVIPAKKIIHGDERALFHYVHLHSNRGVILCSLNAGLADYNSKYRNILENFRISAQKIHLVLSQKKISNIGRHHRNSVPVKEYGILFSYCEGEKEKRTSTTYWVIGRLFNKGHLGEVYVCYEDGIPQNLVEIAFRLAMCE